MFVFNIYQPFFFFFSILGQYFLSLFQDPKIHFLKPKHQDSIGYIPELQQSILFSTFSKTNFKRSEDTNARRRRQ